MKKCKFTKRIMTARQINCAIDVAMHKLHMKDNPYVKVMLEVRITIKA